MLRSFSLGRFAPKALVWRDPRLLVRVALGTLLVANLVTALIAFKPFGGSVQDLKGQEQELRQQVRELQARVARSQSLVKKVEMARTAGDQFLQQYTTDRRTTFSTIFAELNRAAKETGITAKPASIALETVEGSDTLGQMTISAGYEGTYPNLTKFVNALDKSPYFLIIESMTAAPLQAGNAISVSFKLDTFVRDHPGAQ